MSTSPVDLAYRELGEGAPVLVLHGLLGSGRNWQAIAKQLARHRRMVLVDLRDHGDSPWGVGTDYPTMAGDVAALLARLGLERAALVGHSMGGKVAMTLALTRPELVTRLVVVDIAPVPYGGSAFLAYIAALRALDLDAVGRRRALADAALATAVPDAGVRAFLLQNLDTAGERAVWRPNLAELARAMPEIVGFPAGLAQGTYAGPTMVIRGARSDYVTDAHLPRMRALFPRLELVTVPGAGHWVHADAPAVVIDAIGRFLDSPA